MEDGQTYKISFEGLREVLRDNNISPTARLLLMNLLLYAGLDGRCFPSRSTLAKDIGVSTRQIGNLLKELKDNRLIGWKKAGKHPQHNSYYFTGLLYELGQLRVYE